jgi:predicted nucleic acid-binding protein
LRAFLDADVLFTAAHSPGGRAAAIVLLARAGACTLVSSPHALEEASRNLRLKYPDAVRGLAQLLAAVTVEPEAPSADIAWALEQGLPPKDAPIPAAAVHARCEVLVTGDRAHFGAFYGRHLRGVEVLSPAEALERLLG